MDIIGYANHASNSGGYNIFKSRNMLTHNFKLVINIVKYSTGNHSVI